MLEHDMLTLAFVTTYVRLIQGGVGSGVSRDKLPANLRPAHDHIIELRNKRYAHNVGHQTVGGNLAVAFENGVFVITSDYHMDFYIGGAKEWKPLVVFLNKLMFDRLHTQLRRLKEKTGYEWTWPSGPPPRWAEGED